MLLLWCVELFLVVVFVCLGCFTFAGCFEIRLMVALICWVLRFGGFGFVCGLHCWRFGFCVVFLVVVCCLVRVLLIGWWVRCL